MNYYVNGELKCMKELLEFMNKNYLHKMNEKEKIKTEVINFLETFNINLGKTINFREAICTNKENFDRHFTTYSSTEFELTHFAVRISGARIMFMGEILNYEISVDRIIKFERIDDEYLFLEKYSDVIYRRTIIAFA